MKTKFPILIMLLALIIALSVAVMSPGLVVAPPDPAPALGAEMAAATPASVLNLEAVQTVPVGADRTIIAAAGLSISAFIDNLVTPVTTNSMVAVLIFALTTTAVVVATIRLIGRYSHYLQTNPEARLWGRRRTKYILPA